MSFPVTELDGWNNPIGDLQSGKMMQRELQMISTLWDSEQTPVTVVFHRISELDTTKQRGDALEYLTKLYFVTLGETYVQWSELTARQRSELNASTGDMGIDGVWFVSNDKPIAVQCKYRKSAKSVPWRELSTFIGSTFGVSEEYSRALVITTAHKSTQYLDSYADRVDFWTYWDLVHRFNQQWTLMYEQHKEWIMQLEHAFTQFTESRTLTGSIFAQLEQFRYQP